MLTTELVIESTASAVLTCVIKSINDKVAITPVYMQLKRRRRLTRIHLLLSELNNTSSNLTESAAVLVKYFSVVAGALRTKTGTSGYVLIAASCGSEDIYARSIVLSEDFIRLVSALKCHIVISAFPVE